MTAVGSSVRAVPVAAMRVPAILARRLGNREWDAALRATAVLAVALGVAPIQRVEVAPAETLLVTAHGDGAPVVLVPGLFGSAYGWRKVVSLLAAPGRRTIVIEPLAIGGSARPRGADYSLTAQADRIATVLDILGVREAVVVAGVPPRDVLRAAHSNGGQRRAARARPLVAGARVG